MRFSYFFELILLVSFISNHCYCFISSRYVTHTHGNINLVLAIPHDGKNDTNEWPDVVHCSDRISLKNCDGKKFNDEITQSLAWRMNVHLFNGYNVSAYIIIMSAALVKINVDIPITKGCKGNYNCTIAYNNYHKSMERIIKNMSGPVLILDLHSEKQNSNNLIVKYGKLGNANSIQSLQRRTNVTSEDLMCGNYSLMNFFRRETVKVKPAQDDCLTFNLLNKEDDVTLQYSNYSDCDRCVDVIRLDFSEDTYSHSNHNHTKVIVDALMKFIRHYNYSSFQSCSNICKIFTTMTPTTKLSTLTMSYTLKTEKADSTQNVIYSSVMPSTESHDTLSTYPLITEEVSSLRYSKSHYQSTNEKIIFLKKDIITFSPAYFTSKKRRVFSSYPAYFTTTEKGSFSTNKEVTFKERVVTLNEMATVDEEVTTAGEISTEEGMTTNYELNNVSSANISSSENNSAWIQGAFKTEISIISLSLVVLRLVVFVF